MAKVSFKDLTPFSAMKSKFVAESMVGVQGRQRRIKYFSNYMPLGAARRMARIVTLTPGSRRYNPGVVEEMKRLGKMIRLSMKANRYTRSQAIQSVWGNMLGDYRKRYTMESAQDLFSRWLNDVWES